LQIALRPEDMRLAHDGNGKPALEFTDTAHTQAFAGMDISLADGHRLSVAWIGPAPVGVDIELIEARDCETWRGLLGDDGYALALKIERETREPFDAAATRVWTLLEAGKKAFLLRRLLPRFTGSCVGDWLVMNLDADGGACRMLSALVKNYDTNGSVFAMSVVLSGDWKSSAVGITKIDGSVTGRGRAESDILLEKLGFDKDAIGFSIDESGPQGQMVFIHRFPIKFRACKTPSKKVAFSQYGEWMGEGREYAALPIFPKVREMFESSAWAMSTNYFKLDVLDEAGPGDIVETRTWGEHGYGEHGEGWCLACEWRTVGAGNRVCRIASAEMGFSWLKILGHGAARAERMPNGLREFFETILPLSADAERRIVQLPSRYRDFKRGGTLWRNQNPFAPGKQLFSHEFTTSTSNANWAGNVYFANYSEWMGDVRDLYFQQLTPEGFRNSGRDGEWVCLSCAIDHLSEAMPFDRILIAMDVAAIYRSGVDLTFDYLLMENGEISRKLAHGKHTMAWVGRDADNEPVALELPRNVVETLMKELGQRK
jgi:acyl-CoA thioesterase FadM